MFRGAELPAGELSGGSWDNTHRVKPGKECTRCPLSVVQIYESFKARIAWLISIFLSLTSNGFMFSLYVYIGSGSRWSDRIQVVWPDPGANTGFGSSCSYRIWFQIQVLRPDLDQGGLTGSRCSDRISIQVIRSNPDPGAQTGSGNRW